MKELTLEVLRNGGHVQRLDNAPRPKVKACKWCWTDLVPQPKPVDYRKPNEKEQ